MGKHTVEFFKFEQEIKNARGRVIFGTLVVLISWIIILNFHDGFGLWVAVYFLYPILLFCIVFDIVRWIHYHKKIKTL